MADFIKASFDITFESPFGIAPMTQQVMGLSRRISTAAFPPKAIGVAAGLRFRDGIEAEQVEGLHGSISHDGNTHSALPPHAHHLWDLSPSPIPIIRSEGSGSRSFAFAEATIRT